MTKPKQKGRPTHEPNSATRAAVRLLAFGDFTQEQIALRMDMSIPTLVKHYSEDIAGGKTEMVAALMKKDIENALSDSSDARQSRHFLLERKGGFIKVEKSDHTSSDGSMSPKEPLPWDAMYAKKRDGSDT